MGEGKIRNGSSNGSGIRPKVNSAAACPVGRRGAVGVGSRLLYLVAVEMRRPHTRTPATKPLSRSLPNSWSYRKKLIGGACRFGGSVTLAVPRCDDAKIHRRKEDRRATHQLRSTRCKILLSRQGIYSLDVFPISWDGRLPPPKVLIRTA